MQMQNEFILTETNMLEKTFKRTEPAANDHIGELFYINPALLELCRVGSFRTNHNLQFFYFYFHQNF